MDSTSPTTMQKVTIMTKPRAPFTMAVHTMACGSDLEASLSSSDMWVAESGPMKENVGDSVPTRQATPIFPHPAPSVNVVKTCEVPSESLDYQALSSSLFLLTS